MRKQKEEDFWDELEELQSESSLDESNIEDSSLNKLSSDKDNMEVNNKWRDNTRKSLGAQDAKI